MDVAREPGSGRLVRATQAMRGRTYRCPMCKAEVFPRLGRKRDHHFAHWPGQGSPECELFHVGDDIHHPWPTYPGYTNQENDGPPIPPLALGIVLEPETLVRGTRLRQWGLRLTIPKSDDEHGRISIACGGKDLRTIPLSKLMLQSATLPVELDAADFGASWISPEVRPRYRAAVEQRVAGLDHAHVNVFAATTQKYKPRVKSLGWGDSYYFVWRSSAFPALPPTLIARRLAERGAWSCALVTLPDESEVDLQRWLHEACAMRISKDARRWSIVYPVAYDIDIAGHITVAPAASVLVGFEGEDAPTDEHTPLECRVLDARAPLSVPARGRRFVEIATRGAYEKGTVRLSWGGRALPEILRAALPPPDALPSVLLHARPRRGGPAITAHLHQADSQQLLETVRTRACDLVELIVPVGVPGTLNRRARTGDWQIVPLSHSEFTTAAGDVTYRITAEPLAALNRALQDPSLDICLDFSAFGSFYAAAEKPERRAAPALRLDAGLRRKIVWLCKTAGQYPRGGSTIDHLDDVTLVCLVTEARVPASLLAQQRSLQAALHRLGRELPA